MSSVVKNEVIRRTWQDLDPELQEQGYELVEVEYVQEHGPWNLRLYIDKAGGVTLDDCQSVSQLVSVLLDKEDYIDNAYRLEVSSPGFDRPVRKPADFQRFAGERVKATSYVPVAGRKHFKGELKGYRDGLVLVECDGATYEIHLENLKKAHLDR